MPAMEDIYTLIVGIGHHQRINEPPPIVLKDAQDIHDLLVDPQHYGYPLDNIQLLLGGQATQEALR